MVLKRLLQLLTVAMHAWRLAQATCKPVYDAVGEPDLAVRLSASNVSLQTR